MKSMIKNLVLCPVNETIVYFYQVIPMEVFRYHACLEGIYAFDSNEQGQELNYDMTLMQLIILDL